MLPDSNEQIELRNAGIEERNMKIAARKMADPTNR